jgi:hypothetical protein
MFHFSRIFGYVQSWAQFCAVISSAILIKAQFQAQNSMLSNVVRGFTKITPKIALQKNIAL